MCRWERNTCHILLAGCAPHATLQQTVVQEWQAPSMHQRPRSRTRQSEGAAGADRPGACELQRNWQQGSSQCSASVFFMFIRLEQATEISERLTDHSAERPCQHVPVEAQGRQD